MSIKTVVSVLCAAGALAEEASRKVNTHHHDENPIIDVDDDHVPHSRASKSTKQKGRHSSLVESDDAAAKKEKDDKAAKEGEEKKEGKKKGDAECEKGEECESGECKKKDEKDAKGKCTNKGSSCFAGGALVSSFNGSKKVSALEIGDMVKTATGYEPIVGFLHAEEGASTFVELTHTNGKLPVTGDHLVFLADGRAVTASSIKKGDQLVSGVVTEVNEVVREDGIYSPMTKSGTIEVENTMASTYSSVNAIDHSWSHIATAPLRWLGVSPATTARTAAYAPVFSS